MLELNNKSIYQNFLAIDQNMSGKSEKMSLFAMLMWLCYQFCSVSFKQRNYSDTILYIPVNQSLKSIITHN